MSTPILLINFYYEKGLAVKYLAHELNKNGYEPYILYFKEFNEYAPSKASEAELQLLEGLIQEIKPSYYRIKCFIIIILGNCATG